MTSLLSKFCGGVLAATFLVTTPVATMAAPLVAPAVKADTASNVVDVQYRGRDYYPRHRPGPRPGYRPGHRPPPGYWNGHYGYRYQRPGYRYYNGWWYPLAAFGVGAAIGSMAAQPRYYGGGGYTAAHYQYCEDRYRSYRASDNTFQPYNGPRQQCRSPY